MIERYDLFHPKDTIHGPLVKNNEGRYVLYSDHLADQVAVAKAWGEKLAALEAAVKEKDATPDFARGFRAGRECVLRTNLSGCCCKWDDNDEGKLVSLCGAHKEYVEEQIAKQKEFSDFQLNENNGLRKDISNAIIENDKLTAENERLREALEQLADDKGSAYWTSQEVRQIARAALKGEKEAKKEALDRP
jgi:regulator of replication initiation timing